MAITLETYQLGAVAAKTVKTGRIVDTLSNGDTLEIKSAANTYLEYPITTDTNITITVKIEY